MQIETQSLLENMPLALPILFGKRHEFLVQLRVDLRSEFLGHCPGHEILPSTLTILQFNARKFNINLDLSR